MKKRRVRLLGWEFEEWQGKVRGGFRSIFREFLLARVM